MGRPFVVWQVTIYLFPMTPEPATQPVWARLQYLHEMLEVGLRRWFIPRNGVTVLVLEGTQQVPPLPPSSPLPLPRSVRQRKGSVDLVLRVSLLVLDCLRTCNNLAGSRRCPPQLDCSTPNMSPIASQRSVSDSASVTYKEPVWTPRARNRPQYQERPTFVCGKEHGQELSSVRRI